MKKVTPNKDQFFVVIQSKVKKIEEELINFTHEIFNTSGQKLDVGTVVKTAIMNGYINGALDILRSESTLDINSYEYRIRSLLIPLQKEMQEMFDKSQGKIGKPDPRNN